MVLFMVYNSILLLYRTMNKDGETTRSKTASTRESIFTAIVIARRNTARETFIHKLQSETIHLPYSPDLVPRGLIFFPYLGNFLRSEDLFPKMQFELLLHSLSKVDPQTSIAKV